jgi:multicomponent Na+:H+ antiporter subunit E
VSYFAVNLMLAFVWASLMGISFGNFVLGFVLGFVVLALSRPFVGSAGYVRSGLALLRLSVVFLEELVRANLRLARDVLRRKPQFAQAVLRIQVPDLGPGQAAFLGALVSLTPGSITVDISADGKTLFVHTVYARDPEVARRAVGDLAFLIRQIGAGEGTAPSGREEAP